jgi:hypothetical protein
VSAAAEMASAFSGARYLIFALTLYLLPPGAPLTANDRHFLEIQIEPHRHDRLGDSQGVLYSQSPEKLARYGSSALSGAEQREHNFVREQTDDADDG